jgi:hypothetical protein
VQAHAHGTGQGFEGALLQHPAIIGGIARICTRRALWRP